MINPMESGGPDLPFDMTDVFRYMRENAVSRLDVSIETEPGIDDGTELGVRTTLLERRDIDETATVEASKLGLEFSFFVVRLDMD